MRKNCSILMLVALGMFFNISNGIASCDGNFVISCSVGDTVDIINSANENCCKGDVIEIIDCDTNESYSYTVPTNGSSSSCGEA